MTDSTAGVHDRTPAYRYGAGVCGRFVVRPPESAPLSLAPQLRSRASLASHYSALSSVSPVRMRMTRSMSVMKILPSPTLPVFADFVMASIT